MAEHSGRQDIDMAPRMMRRVSMEHDSKPCHDPSAYFHHICIVRGACGDQDPTVEAVTMSNVMEENCSFTAMHFSQLSFSRCSKNAKCPQKSLQARDLKMSQNIKSPIIQVRQTHTHTHISDVTL